MYAYIEYVSVFVVVVAVNLRGVILTGKIELTEKITKTLRFGSFYVTHLIRFKG